MRGSGVCSVEGMVDPLDPLWLTAGRRAASAFRRQVLPWRGKRGVGLVWVCGAWAVSFHLSGEHVHQRLSVRMAASDSVPAPTRRAG